MRFPSPKVPALAAAVLAVAVLFSSRLAERAVLALARDPALRAAAIERMVQDPRARRAILEADDDPLLRERALRLEACADSPGELSSLLTRRLTAPTLVDLRSLGAVGDEQALEPLAGILAYPDMRARLRLAAFTAFAAIIARKRVPLERVPLPALSQEALETIAGGLDEDAREWRVDVARALADRLPHVVVGHRERCEPDTARDLLLLRGDLPLTSLSADALDRGGLLAPRARLVPGRAEFAQHLVLGGWGRGGWRLVEAIVRAHDGRALVEDALACKQIAADVVPGVTALLERKRSDRRPDPPGGLLEDPVFLERCARDGTLEDLPPFAVEAAVRALGEQAIAPLLRAAGEPSGRLLFVLEPGAGTARARFLTDLALCAFSTRSADER